MMDCEEREEGSLSDLACGDRLVPAVSSFTFLRAAFLMLSPLMITNQFWATLVSVLGGSGIQAGVPTCVPTGAYCFGRAPSPGLHIQQRIQSGTEQPVGRHDWTRNIHNRLTEDLEGQDRFGRKSLRRQRCRQNVGVLFHELNKSTICACHQC